MRARLCLCHPWSENVSDTVGRERRSCVRRETWCNRARQRVRQRLASLGDDLGVGLTSDAGSEEPFAADRLREEMTRPFFFLFLQLRHRASDASRVLSSVDRFFLRWIRVLGFCGSRSASRQVFGAPWRRRAATTFGGLAGADLDISCCDATLRAF